MALVTQHLTLAYDQTVIIDNLDFSLSSGEFTLLMGPSGSGKSTFLKAMAGLYPQFGGQVSGQITLDQASVSQLPANQRAEKVALLFQHPDEQFAMPTVSEELIFALENLALPAEEIDRRIAWALDKVGMTDFYHRSFITLSGGELQKIALVETLALGAKYLLLDEPFAAVDSKARAELQSLLKELVQEGYAILVSDHDAYGYLPLINNLYQLKDRRLVWQNPDQWGNFAWQSQSYHLSKQQASAALFTFNAFNLSSGGQGLLENYQGQLAANAVSLITGPNGVGKSTLLKSLAKLQPYQGELFYQKHLVSKISRKKYFKQVALVFQNAREQFLTITVQEELNQVLARSNQKDYWTKERVDQVLATLQLENHRDHSVYILSGGQQKKLQVLLMLIMAPAVLLLDEPLAGLDVKSAQILVSLIDSVQKACHLSLVIISHQVQPLVPILDYHLVFTPGQLNDSQEVRA
ncbi:ABC transporter ATP-binding protein [Convivina praedatoris]|uniref:HMP/thiamine import ATP-binding protein YkoD n=1 Tax=Convivina praedatoris TaxID=2880963 RepID=A0ABN8HDR2_9LACO|nr:ABC transporter ATP-binding protein [Convivina sp. LMG 32447]CAH1853678.1 Putative HMP/thiamine import ATP-binding protein YkoD [Convivina sp. LMG 32447]CAH1854697.1 Putative HMP/thiamine import ATP-binding protein YkoD [Convivina sp. LMG 32447]CAH1855137.1 Putative HMP/thiamine import ATP-binding protein YkoD [Convivina sp. LMG 32447]